MDNKQLAIACKKAGQCRFCKEPVRQECLKNECWQATYPKDRMPPAVYYGAIVKAPSLNPEEDREVRAKWFAEHSVPYEAERPIMNLF